MLTYFLLSAAGFARGKRQDGNAGHREPVETLRGRNAGHPALRVPSEGHRQQTPRPAAAGSDATHAVSVSNKASSDRRMQILTRKYILLYLIHFHLTLRKVSRSQRN
jgi:hypothetical protein